MDDERRRLERNLHDGAQQNLVALKIKVNLVGITIDKDPARARALVEVVKVESTVYFCCLEALQNIQEYASASSAVVTIAQLDSHLEFSVRDTAVGFDAASVERRAGLQNITDRLDAVGGKVVIESAPGRGATVGGRVPVPLPARISVPA